MVDPTGHFCISAIIIGAIVGAVIGASIVGYQDYKDDGKIFNGSKTVGDYALGVAIGGAAGAAVGAAVGAVSAAGGVGAAVKAAGAGIKSAATWVGTKAVAAGTAVATQGKKIIEGAKEVVPKFIDGAKQISSQVSNQVSNVASKIVDSSNGMQSPITGYTKHGLNQVIGRDGGVGVSPNAILETVRNPLEIIEQSGERFKFVGEQANVVLNKYGRIITAYAKGSEWTRGGK